MPGHDPTPGSTPPPDPDPSPDPGEGRSKRDPNAGSKFGPQQGHRPRTKGEPGAPPPSTASEARSAAKGPKTPSSASPAGPAGPGEHEDPSQSHLGLRTLRRYSEGVLAFGDRRSGVRFVLDRRTGRVVMPVEQAVLAARDHVLFLPGETGCVLQVLLLMDELPNPSGHEAPDRWKAYHAAAVGSPPSSGVWTAATIEAGKTETLVFPGEELLASNPLWAEEARLVRELNADRARIARACRLVLGVDVPDPVVVGVDPLGLDVRARFGVLRLEFAGWAHDEAEARSAIGAVLTRDGAGSDA